MDLDAILGPGGLLAAQLPAHEPRPGQLAMARAVTEALARHRHLLVEAPTGTGKTMAYCAPAALAAAAGHATLIATANITLQEQLVTKDLPLLQRCLPGSFSFGLLKGRANYLCLERLERLLRDASLFEEPPEAELAAHAGDAGEQDGGPARVAQLPRLLEWARTTESGDCSELPFAPERGLWARLSVGHEECRGADCPQRQRCFANQARERAQELDLVVCNYHLLLAHLAVRAEAQRDVLLPAADLVICDEGHRLPDIARDFFATRVGEASLRWAGRLLPAIGERALQRRLHAEAAGFGQQLAAFLAGRGRRRLTQADPPLGGETLLAVLASAAAAYERAGPELDDEARRHDVAVARRRCAALTQILGAALHPEQAPPFGPEPDAGAPGRMDQVIYVEAERQRDPALCVRPLSAAPLLRRLLFEAYDCVVLTSATLSVAGRWDYLASELGLRDGAEGQPGREEAACAAHETEAFEVEEACQEEDAFQEEEVSRNKGGVQDERSRLLVADPQAVPTSQVGRAGQAGRAPAARQAAGAQLIAPRVAALAVPSPWELARRVLLVVPDGLPDPSEPGFAAAAVEHLAQVVVAAGGRTLALFTSYRMLQLAHERLRALPYPLLKQGDLPRTRLIEVFRADLRSVLLGTESFRAGVDVPGEALSCLVLDRLPFTAPDDPLVQALQERDPDTFRRYSLPRAVIAFKQGFGRLIRARDDRGVVVVLDRRLLTKSYGRVFLASLPRLPVTRCVSEIGPFLAHGQERDEACM